MRKTMIAFSAILACGILLGVVRVNVHAETRQERYKRLQYECHQKYLDELEAAGNLTQEAIDALDGPNSTRKPNHKSSSNENRTESKGSGYSNTGKGWVYSTDELHVVGLPVGENGYTQPGYYGDID